MSHKVPINDIKVLDRSRIDLGDIDQLKGSIERKGLINPICVRREDLRLIAGERRLIACKSLAWTEIDVKFYDELSDLELTELELEENVHKEMGWYEKSYLRAKIHNLKQELYGKATKGHASNSWSLDDTAKSLGVTSGTISQDFQIVKFAKINPAIKNITAKRQAIKLISRFREQAILTEISSRQLKVDSRMPYILINRLAEEALFDLDDEIVDLIITDPPYAIDIHKIADSRGFGGAKASYKDPTAFEFEKLMSIVVEQCYRILKPDSHMYMFFGIQWYQWMLELLGKYFDVREVPLIWIKEGGGYTDFEFKFMPQHEYIFFCTKGVRRLNFECSDVFIYNRPPSTERTHTQQKPIELLTQFIKISSAPNDMILDPFAGSGSTIEAATLNKRRSIGIESDPLIFTSMQDRLMGFSSASEKDENKDEEIESGGENVY